LQRTLNWIRSHPGQTPQGYKDFGTLAGKIQVDYLRLTSGTGHKDRKGIFPNAEDFWLELYRFGQSQGVEIPLLDAKFYGDVPPALKIILRRQALQRVLDWIRTHRGQTPRQHDFGEQEGKIRISYARLTSTIAIYKNGAGLFPSAEDFWRALSVLGQSQGTPISLLPRFNTGKNKADNPCGPLLSDQPTDKD
jgi:hypothetical protein